MLDIDLTTGGSKYLPARYRKWIGALAAKNIHLSIKYTTVMKHRARPFPHYKFPDEIEISVKQMSDKDCQWFGCPIGSFNVSCINYGWFPTEVLTGSINGKFADTNNVGLTISGNMGSASVAVIDKETTIKLLTKAGYIVLK